MCLCRFGHRWNSSRFDAGLREENLKTQVIPVRVADEKLYANAGRMMKLFRSTSALLRSFDPSFPKLELSPDDVRSLAHGKIKGECHGQAWIGFVRFPTPCSHRLLHILDQRTFGMTALRRGGSPSAST